MHTCININFSKVLPREKRVCAGHLCACSCWRTHKPFFVCVVFNVKIIISTICAVSAASAAGMQQRPTKKNTRPEKIDLTPSHGEVNRSDWSRQCARVRPETGAPNTFRKVSAALCRHEQYARARLECRYAVAQSFRVRAAVPLTY